MIEVKNATLSIQDAVTGEWLQVRPAADPVEQLAVGWDPDLIVFDEFASITPKIWLAIGRPRGMSQSHWRKVSRDRKPFDIQVSQDPTEERR